MAMRDPKEMAREWMAKEGPYPGCYGEEAAEKLADIIREAQEDGARHAMATMTGRIGFPWSEEMSPDDVGKTIATIVGDAADRLKTACHHREVIANELEAQVAALTERAERAEGQRDDAANKAMQAIESLNANVTARRNAHPRGCCDWSCDLCAPLLVLDEKGNG